MAAATKAGEDQRQAQLSSVIQGAVAPYFAKIEALICQGNIQIGTMAARLDQIDAIISKGGVAAKKTTKAAAGKKAGAKDGKPKLTNSLLYFRFECSKNEGFREKFLQPETVEALREHESLAKKDEQKDPESWWSTLANQAWRTHLTEEDKAEVKQLFEQFKENGANASEQLDAEAEAE